MAKRIKDGSCMWRICGGGASAPRLMVESYQLDDNTDATITGYTLVGNPVDGPRRDLTKDELSGTLQEFLDAREVAFKTAEGIS